MADSIGANNVLPDSTGESPKVSDNLEVTNRAIKDVDQAFSICQTMVNDWKKGILHAARITAKLNGERPYNQKKLDEQGKNWKSNVSTGFLATECGKILPRFYMPIKTSKYLTAAQLPADWPNTVEKTQHFRQTITDAIRSWPKFNFYLRGKAREVGIFGFCHDVWFDDYDWRPTLMRVDRGFVPQGTEIMEEPAFFMAKWDYKPDELLTLLRNNIEANREEWKKDNVVKAINGAFPPPVDSTYPEARKYEDLLKEFTWAYTYTKGAKVIRTWHLFSKEPTGKVSHYVLLADSGGTSANQNGSPVQPERLLYENLDQYDSMDDAVKTTVFDYGDGTVHGSWGAGHILYDLAVYVEKVRCDSIDNIRLTNKVKAQVPDAKNVNDVKLVVNDHFVIVSGAQFSGNTAGITSDVQGYESLDQKLTQIAQQKIGAFIPPIPLQPSDIKAAQINAEMMKENEIKEALLENWLIQWADVVRTITRRLCDPNSMDETARTVRSKLLEKLTEEEIQILVTQFPVKSVIDFTEFKSQQRGAFAASVKDNPMFNQNTVARIMAEGAGDESFVEAIVIKDGDQSLQVAAQRQQILETGVLGMGRPVPIVPQDNDWIHMQVLKPDLAQMLQGDNVNLQVANTMLQHYAAHYAAAVNKKAMPKDQINSEKQWIASAEKNIAMHQERQNLQAKATALGSLQQAGVPNEVLAQIASNNGAAQGQQVQPQQ